MVMPENSESSCALSSCEPQSTTRISMEARSLEPSSAERQRRSAGALSYENISAVTRMAGGRSISAGGGSAWAKTGAPFCDFHGFFLALGLTADRLILQGGNR